MSEEVIVQASEGYEASTGLAAPNLSEGQRVQVKGKFQEFDLQTFEEELRIDLKNDPFADFAGRPAIQAQQIQQK